MDHYTFLLVEWKDFGEDGPIKNIWDDKKITKQIDD